MATHPMIRVAVAALAVVALAAGCGGSDDSSEADTSPDTSPTVPEPSTDAAGTDSTEAGESPRSLPGMTPCEASGELTADGEVYPLDGATAGVQRATSGPPAFYQVLVPDSDGTISLYASGNGFVANVIVGLGQASSGSELDDGLDIRSDGTGVDVEVTTVVPVAGDPAAVVRLRLDCA